MTLAPTPSPLRSAVRVSRAEGGVEAVVQKQGFAFRVDVQNATGRDWTYRPRPLHTLASFGAPGRPSAAHRGQVLCLAPEVAPAPATHWFR